MDDGKEGGGAGLYGRWDEEWMRGGADGGGRRGLQRWEKKEVRE